MSRTQVAISTEYSPQSDFSISVWDVNTGNLMSSYKSPKQSPNNKPLLVPRHCIDRIGYQYLICGYSQSPLVNVWRLDKRDSLHLKMILPAPVDCLAITLDGCYCLAGIGSRIYIWQISTGYLVSMIDQHYQTVRVIRITNDLTYFVSGGDDGLIMIWSFHKCLSPSDRFTVIGGQSSRSEPIKRIQTSLLKIIDIYLNEGGLNAGRFAVCYENSHIIEIYQLRTGQLLANVSFDQQITAILMDRTELSLYCGSNEGDIFETSFSVIGSDSKKPNSEVISIFIDSKEKNEKKNQQKFLGHQKTIWSMAVSIDGHALVSASEDCTIRIWHIGSRQCMRTINCKGPVLNLMVYPALGGLFLNESSFLENKNFDLSFGSTQVDISLAASSSTNKSIINRHHQSKSSSLSDRTLPNPPPPVTIFQRDLYQPKVHPYDVKLSTSNGQRHSKEKSNSNHIDSKNCLGNAFDQGCVMIQNDSRLGQMFWPDWSDYWMPTEGDLEKSYSHKDSQNDWTVFNSCDEIRDDLVSVMNGKNQHSVPKTLNSNKSRKPDEQNDELKDSIVYLSDKVHRLESINQKIYKYAIEKIFQDTFAEKNSSEKRMIDDLMKLNSTNSDQNVGSNAGKISTKD